MKKSLLALAVLGAFTGVASAQSSVSLYGTLDVNGRYVKNDGSDRRMSLGQDGINGSQLGFRGVEDLGGGLKASFVLLAGINADSGTANAKFWNRRATVSLSSNFGEIRLGRDYTPTFWNYGIFDAFGVNGVGNSGNVLPALVVNSTFVRADNSIGYFLPTNLGGLYGQFMAAAGEGGNLQNAAGQQLSATASGQICRTQGFGIQTGQLGNCTTAINSNSGQYLGGRIGFAAGPFDVAASYGELGVDSLDEKSKNYSVGGSWDFGFLKVMGWYGETKLLNLKNKGYSVSGVIPLGAGEIHVGYSSAKTDGAPIQPKSDQAAIGYVYNLSKRTAVYSNASFLKNHDGAQNQVLSGGPSAGSIAAPPTPSGESKGIEFGVRHFF